MSSSDRLKKLKALKSRKRIKDEEDDDRIYDEVSTEEYRKVTRDRLMEDDFVVGDDGEGYAETGAYDWEEGHNYYSDEEDVKPSKKKLKTKESKSAKNDGNLTKLFRSAPKPKPKETTVNPDDSRYIDDLISGLGNESAGSTSRENKRKLAPRKREEESLLPKLEREIKVEQDELKPEPIGSSPSHQMMDVDSPPAVPAVASSPSAQAAERRENDSDDEDDDLKPKPLSGGVATKNINFSGVKVERVPSPPPNSSQPQTSQAKEDTTSWLGVNATVANDTIDAGNGHQTSAKFEELVDNDGAMKFFWMDYEEKNNNLFLYGKAKNSKNDSCSSCMLRLTDLFRTIYVLFGKDEEGEEQEAEDVYNELCGILRRNNVERYFVKPVTMKYCFELPDVPRGEANYMQVVVPFSAKIDWENHRADTFTKVFGANKSAFEEFVLSRKVMGPCWLGIENAKELPNASWCKTTASVSLDKAFFMSDDVSVISDNEAPPVPPLTVMSLSIRTLQTNQSNKQEVFAISGRVYHNVSHDTTQPANEIRSTLFTEVRPQEQLFPSGFEKRLEQESPKHTYTHKTEASLLRKFVTMVQGYDPDVIVGHELLNVHLSVLAHRLKANDIKFWDKMGRRRQDKFPSGFGSSAYEYRDLREITSGRLLCDLSNDMGQSMTTKCSSWSLTEMCDLYLDDMKRVDVDVNASKCTWNRDAEGLIRFLSHNEVDAYCIAALAFRIQILALSKQLTNLAGNSWARTLAGSRVDRNEFILLHEFTNQGYIVPDKGYSNKRGATKDKDKFQGGMVLEPERGLHKEIVLVMDFNSLYPSVIQEYNICFTTVERSQCKSVEDPPPQPPSKEVPMGLFPQLVQNLVLRRREVKKLIKSGGSSTEMAQWDIKQQALKLTANSMYGCLGYQGSRFYALPLAMLTTQKGREALKSTQELAEDNSLHVVYGDTDSVMINTNVINYKQAINVGEEFKKVVNQQYKHLEIDIDNVFQCILLQAKKKYAALQMFERKNGEIDTKMEIKGLDLKRREYCQLSKDASNKFLEEIMSQDNFEQAQGEIFDYSAKLATDIREHKIQPARFIIRTRLGKDPKSYTSTEGMPSVRMALRRRQNGEIIKAGDVMQFIICEGDGPVGDRAFTLAEYKRQGLKYDAEYYLLHQILPPLERLLSNIEGAEIARLAEAMGLDTRKYHKAIHTNAQDRDIQPLESTIPDKERFANAVRLSLTCQSCQEKFDFEGICEKSVKANGVVCPSCSVAIPMTKINIQLECTVRKQLSKYYAGWLVCDDPSCGGRTRQINVYGKRCTQQDGDCRGIMRWEYNDKELYNQLLYFDSLFDVDRATAKSEGSIQVKALAEQNRQRFAVSRHVIDKYLTNCGRRYVDMHDIFSFM